MQLLAAVYEGLLCLYSYMESYLSRQIQIISKAAYSLFHLFQMPKITIPSQLYHDIQCTFIDSVVCIAKLHIKCPDSQVYLVLNGTDTVERFFGDRRSMYKHNTFDALDLLYCANAISRCDNILIRHSEWVRKGRTSRRLALDYSNIKDLTGDLVVGKVNIVKDWKIGLYDFQCAAIKIDIDFELYAFEKSGVTLKKLSGRLVGVSIVEHEEATMIATDVHRQEENMLAEIITPRASPYDCMIDIDKELVYKASILKKLTASNPLSRDRLRRVQGLTTFHEQEAYTDLDDLISVGDPVIFNHNDITRVGNILEIFTGVEKLHFLPQEQLQQPYIMLNVRVLKLKEFDDCLFWDGTSVGSPVRFAGIKCISIEPQISMTPPKNMPKYFFNKELVSSIEGQIFRPTPQDEADDVENVPCLVCKKKIMISKMRLHTAFHIIRGDIHTPRERICGFCGGDGCMISLKKTSHKGNKKYYLPYSRYRYFYAYKGIQTKSTKTNSCTNRIIVCPLCNMYSWSYNLQAHYIINHQTDTVPAPYSDDEKKFIKKMTFK